MKSKAIRDQEILRRHANGESVTSLATEYGITPSRVSQILTNLGLPRPERKVALHPFEPRTVDPDVIIRKSQFRHALKMFLSGNPDEEVAEFLGDSWRAFMIGRMLRRDGLL